jgi:hypothetical protein
VSTEGRVWAGYLDLDEDALVPLTGPARPSQAVARILIKLNHTPVGVVHVPLWPSDTLAKRARATAEIELAARLRRCLATDGAAVAPTNGGA